MLHRHRLNERGQALLLLLVVAVLVVPLVTGFVSSMFLQDRLAGERYRSIAALYLAEAGINKTLWYLDGEAPDGSGDASWRPTGYTEDLRAGDLRGRFVVDVRDEAEGRVSLVSWGEVGRIRRGVQVVAKIAPGVLDYALFGAGLVAVEGDQALLLLVEVRDHCLPGVMLASNTEIWFRTPGSRLQFVPCGENPAVLKIGLPNLLRLTVGDAHGAARYLGLREYGVEAGPVEMETIEPEATPAVDLDALRRRAEKNEANADLNAAAGEAANNDALRNKRDSLYTADEFALVLRHLRGRNGVLLGPVDVSGRALVPADVPLTITNGFLATEGGLTVEPRGRLTVSHGRRAKLLPGIVTSGEAGTLVIGEEAQVRVDGLVFAEGLVDIRDAARLQVVGAVVAAAPKSSLRLNNGRLSVQYDPAVPGTTGLLARGGRHRVFPLAWHEIR